MQIKDIFRRDIERDIKEVIKVDDGSSILEEVEEYVPTERITEQLLDVLDKYQDTVLNPSDEINIWVSGFFGSGKSSFAKVLGYLLADAPVGDTTVSRHFFERHDIPKAKALLANIHRAAPTEAVLLDINTTHNALETGESIVLPIYRTVLESLGYSTDFLLAELEFALEQDGTLAPFEARYEQVFQAPWESRRHVILAKNQASRVLHELNPDTYPAADSWSGAATKPTINAKWFAKRAMEMLRRRRPAKKRLVLIVDEVGQYVAHSTDRLRQIQGLAEECQKTAGALWLIATSQEKLTDIVDGLDGKQTELSKAKDRFPIRVDLLPSDIDEVTGKRILDKTAVGAAQIRRILDDHRPKLAVSVNLDSDRHRPFSDEDFVRLYPLVPYQLNVLIAAVSARRTQVGASQALGGSNRTLIRHAQQLLSHNRVGLKNDEVGALVTLDRSYELLEDVIATAWRGEVDQVAKDHGPDSLEAKVMRVVALCSDMPGLALNGHNIAALLHPSMSSPPLTGPVGVALGHLVNEDRLRESDGGAYLMQSPEQKTWDQTRRGLDMKPRDAARLGREILRDEFGALTVKADKNSRTFKVQVLIANELLTTGDIVLDIRNTSDIGELETESRSEASQKHIFWAYSLSNKTWDALLEWHRSVEMISRGNTASQTDADRQLLSEEQQRGDRGRNSATRLLAADLAAGTTIFQGRTDSAPSGAIRAAAERRVSELLPDIYPNLALFAGSFNKADIAKILGADTLDGLPESVGPDGLGLFRITGKGRQLVTDQGPINEVITFIVSRQQYGDDQSGGQLHSHFADPPYGATIEALQAVLAGAMRTGLLEVRSQAARITSARDGRLEPLLANTMKFKAATFMPAKDSGPSLDERSEVAEWLQEFTGRRVGFDLGELAHAAGRALDVLHRPCVEARASLNGAGLVVPAPIDTLEALLSLVHGDDEGTVVLTIHQRGADLIAGRDSVDKLKPLLDEELSPLRAAQDAVKLGQVLGDDEFAAAAANLQQLLDKADYVTDLARIKSLTTRIEDQASVVTATTKTSLSEAITTDVHKLRSRYDTVKDDDFDAAVAPLLKLNGALELGDLRSNRKSLPWTVTAAAEKLAGLSTNLQVRHVKAADVWGRAITNETELDAALALLRRAVLDKLEAGTEVRFQ